MAKPLPNLTNMNSDELKESIEDQIEIQTKSIIVTSEMTESLNSVRSALHATLLQQQAEFKLKVKGWALEQKYYKSFGDSMKSMKDGFKSFFTVRGFLDKTGIVKKGSGGIIDNIFGKREAENKFVKAGMKADPSKSESELKSIFQETQKLIRTLQEKDAVHKDTLSMGFDDKELVKEMQIISDKLVALGNPTLDKLQSEHNDEMLREQTRAIVDALDPVIVTKSDTSDFSSVVNSIKLNTDNLIDHLLLSADAIIDQLKGNIEIESKPLSKPRDILTGAALEESTEDAKELSENQLEVLTEIRDLVKLDADFESKQKDDKESKGLFSGILDFFKTKLGTIIIGALAALGPIISGAFATAMGGLTSLLGSLGPLLTRLLAMAGPVAAVAGAGLAAYEGTTAILKTFGVLNEDGSASQDGFISKAVDFVGGFGEQPSMTTEFKPKQQMTEAPKSDIKEIQKPVESTSTDKPLEASKPLAAPKDQQTVANELNAIKEQFPNDPTRAVIKNGVLIATKDWERDPRGVYTYKKLEPVKPQANIGSTVATTSQSIMANDKAAMNKIPTSNQIIAAPTTNTSISNNYSTPRTPSAPYDSMSLFGVARGYVIN